MKRYEYRIEQIQIELKSILKSDKSAYNKEIVEKLNLLGEEGWELAAVDGNEPTIILERIKESQFWEE